VRDSLQFRVEEASTTAAVRRAARKMATNIGLNERGAEEVAIVVSEACTNLLKHVGHGEILLHTTGEEHDPLPRLELLALDQGPGMHDLQQCITDGFSTVSTAGQGLGAIMRLSKESDFYSMPRKGTAVLARWFSPALQQVISPDSPAMRIGAVNISKPGQDSCGDSWGALQSSKQLTILVADGLGHGPEANVASSEAVRMLRNYSELSPKALLERVHLALRSTRGAAVAVARLDLEHAKLTFAGVGNISGQIYSDTQGRRHLVSANGTAGHECQRLREFVYDWPSDALLVLHSDGLNSSTGLEPYPGLALRDPGLIAGVLYRDCSRGNDDSTVVVAKAA
jgi:anti-sigma regulatory factor (Ser/Thr protein kinase)